MDYYPRYARFAARNRSLKALAVAVVFAAVPAYSQGQENNTASEETAIAEIIVSARRIEQSLQDVPASIAAFTGEELQSRGIERGEDLLIAIPNVVVAGGASGSGTTELVSRGVPDVGTYIDGIYHSSSGLTQTNLLDLERVEFLRGPQGTLFGRDTNGGALLFTTKRPANEFQLRSSVTVGNFSRLDVTAVADLPLTDTLLSKVTVGSFNQDGQIPSRTSNLRFGGRDDETLRAEISWMPKDDFDVRVVATTRKTTGSDRRNVFIEDIGDPWILAHNTLVEGGFSDLPSVTQEITLQNYQPGYPGGSVGKFESMSTQPEDSLQFDTDQLYAIANWDISDSISLQSYSSIYTKEEREYVARRAMDVVLFVEDDTFRKEDTWTQEFHLSGSSFDSRLTWLGGLYYQETEFTNIRYRFFKPEFFLPGLGGPGTPWVLNQARFDFVEANVPNTPQGEAAVASIRTAERLNNRPFVDAETTGSEFRDYAIFGEAYLSLTDRIEITLGARLSQNDQYTRTYQRNGAHRPFYGQPIVGDPFDVSVVESVKEEGIDPWFTPKVAVSFDWSDDVMIYASYAEGFTQGEVNIEPILGRIELDPEVVKSFEIGWHARLLDRRVQFNGSLFFMNWEGIRVNIVPEDPENPGQFLPFTTTISGGQAEASGLESELQWFINDGLRLHLAVGFLDTAYKNINPTADIVDGQRFPHAPDFSGNAGALYTLPLNDGGDMELRLDYRYMSDYVLHPRESSQRLQPGFGLWSSRATYRPAEGSWSAFLYGYNLANQHYVTLGFKGVESGLFGQAIGKPREYGVGFNFTF
ncbi:MAG: TonB-dependent receptor [Haliea sp.]